MRTVTFILTGLVGAVWAAMVSVAFYRYYNPAAPTLAHVYTIASALPVLAFSVPAFILALLNRAPRTALILAVLGVLLLIAAIFML